MTESQDGQESYLANEAEPFKFNKLLIVAFSKFSNV